MTIDHLDLLLLWIGGGFILLLVWLGVMGQALLGPGRTAVPPAIGALALVGLANPVAALCAVDLIRMCRTLDEPELDLPAWSLPAAEAIFVVGLLVAGGLWLTAGGLP